MNSLVATPKSFSLKAYKETTYKNDFVLEVLDESKNKTASFGANYNKIPEVEAEYIAKCLNTLGINLLLGYSHVEPGLDIENLPSVTLINEYLKTGVKLTFKDQ